MTKLGIPCAEDEQELARPPRKKPRSNLLLRKVLALKVGESRQEVSDSFDNDGLEGRPTPEEELGFRVSLFISWGILQGKHGSRYA